MILELLGSEPDPLRALSVALRIGSYLTCLGAAGLGIFAIGFAHLQSSQDTASCRRLTMNMAGFGVIASLLWLAAQVAQASGGDLLDTEVWEVMITSRPGISVLLAWVGLIAVAAATLMGRQGVVVGGLGVGAIAVSFTAIGHTTQHQPQWLLAALLVVHLVAVSFWAGSLWPLALAAKKGGATAVQLVQAWARSAAWIVGALIVAGAVLAWLLVGSLEALFTTTYGQVLVVKLALVGVLLSFAAWHRFRLTPALASGDPVAGRRLATSIGWEIVVMVLVFWAVAELTSVSPSGSGSS